MNPIFVLSVLDSESYTLQFWYTFLHSVEPDISHEVIYLPILLNLKFNPTFHWTETLWADYDPMDRF
jgi:hypothetical protein